MFSNPKFLWVGFAVSSALNVLLLLNWPAPKGPPGHDAARSDQATGGEKEATRPPADLEALRKKLLQMETPPGVVRRVIKTMVDRQLEPEREALRRLHRGRPFWVASASGEKELVNATHEFDKVRMAQLAAALGGLGLLSDEERELSRIRFGAADPDFIRRCEAIRLEFRESRQADIDSRRGLTFGSDQAKLDQSVTEEFAEVRRVLGDDALFREYLLRASPGARALRHTAVDPEFSEEEFRAAFAAFLQLGGNVYSENPSQKPLLEQAIQSVRAKRAPAAREDQP